MSNPDQSPALSLEEFRHWLNNRRMMDVSMAFGDIVERYREATEAAAMAATVPAELDSYTAGSAMELSYRQGWNECRKAMLAAQAPVAGQPAEPSPAKPWEYSKIEKRIQELMAGAGLPNSMSVARAMKQLVNELHHEYGPNTWGTPVPPVGNCERCGGSGEDPEGFYDQSRGPDGDTHDGPCRGCSGSGAAPKGDSNG